MHPKLLDQESPLGSYFGPLKPRLSDRVMSQASFDKIKNLADTLPHDVSSFWGFEVPLHLNSDISNGDADFLFCSTQSEHQARVLAGDSQSEIPAGYLELPAWSKVQAFCKKWEDQSHVLHKQLLNVWLEFDVASNEPPYQPSFFFGLLPPERTTPAKRRRVITTALNELNSGVISQGFTEALNTVMIRRDSSWIFQVGLMMSRNTEAIRVCIRDLASTDEVMHLVHDLEWPGDLLELRSLLTELEPMCHSIDLDIDLSTGPDGKIGPKLGIECSFGRSQAVATYTKKFTEWLLDRGFLTEEGAAGLIAYNGLVHQDADPSAWPDHLIKRAAITGPDVANQIACWVHHIKVVYQPSEPLSAKAYLAALPDRTSRRVLLERIKANNLV